MPPTPPLLRNIEAIRLYRDILRTTKHFTWLDESGQPWREVLRANARKEFELARHETDPEMIARLLVGGRDCLNQITEKLIDKLGKQ